MDGGGGSDDDPLKALKADIGAARGRAVLTETTSSSGWGEGRSSAAHMSDWTAAEVSGPEFRRPLMPEIARDSFAQDAGSLPAPRSPCSTTQMGPSQREALRRWHMGKPSGRWPGCWSTNCRPSWTPRCGSSSMAIRSTCRAEPPRFRSWLPEAWTSRRAAAVSGLLVDDDG